MAEVAPTPDGSVEAAAEQLRGILSPEPEGPREEEQAAQAPQEVEVEEPETEEEPEVEAEAETEGDVEEYEEVEESDDSPAIPPPSSWPDADRATWSTLPPDVQETVVRRERERDAAFTQRQQEVAEQVRQAEQAAAQLAAERQHYAEQLAPFITQLEAEVTGQATEAELDALLEAGDTYEYELKKRDIEKKRASLDALKGEQQRIQSQQAQEQLRQLQVLRNEEEAKLIQALPAWSKPETATAEKKRIGDYLKGYGYTDQDLGMIYDHRYLVLAHKARLYDQLRNSKPEVAKKAKGANPVVRPGTPGSKTERAQQQGAAKMKTLRDNPNSIDAAAAIFADLLKE